jgi:tRNA threonylcarbamoyladenosine biosynthesis protein TsaB
LSSSDREAKNALPAPPGAGEPEDSPERDAAAQPEPAQQSATAPEPDNNTTTAAKPAPGSPPILVLAIDTALDACSVAVYEVPTDRTLAAETQEMNRGHAEALLPMVDRVMQKAGIEFAAIDRIVTTVGPGSFTGLRVGISAARGIALVTGKPAVGVSTLAALAAPLVTENETVPTVAAIDARHENLYLQMSGAGGRLLVSPRVLSLDDALRAVAIGLVRIVGSGAHLLASQWPAPEVPTPLLIDARPAPDIVWVARLGAGLDPGKAPPRPLYLRPPDARPQDAHRLQRR